MIVAAIMAAVASAVAVADATAVNALCMIWFGVIAFGYIGILWRFILALLLSGDVVGGAWFPHFKYTTAAVVLQVQSFRNKRKNPYFSTAFPVYRGCIKPQKAQYFFGCSLSGLFAN